MNLVLDTNVFLPLLAGGEEAGKVFSKIIAKCDKVVTDDRIVLEYTDVLRKNGHGARLVQIKLAELDAHQKLIHDKRKVQRLEVILTHEKDRQFVECAHAYECAIITYEINHFINIRTGMKTQLKLDIYLPSEYLELER